MTGTYESIIPLIEMDFDGLKEDIVRMISGEAGELDVSTFRNDMVTFHDKDDVMTVLCWRIWVILPMTKNVRKF